jgi:hypothetical protein
VLLRVLGFSARFESGVFGPGVEPGVGLVGGNAGHEDGLLKKTSAPRELRFALKRALAGGIGCRGFRVGAGGSWR